MASHGRWQVIQHALLACSFGVRRLVAAFGFFFSAFHKTRATRGSDLKTPKAVTSHRTPNPKFAAIILVFVLISRAAVEAAPLPQEMLADAELADVAFIDPDRGWAVGDRGVIWDTQDGGRHWQLQNSGVGCCLESVCFIDGENGWAAGGFTHPYTHKSTGVILRTRDGGRRWMREPTMTLPALKQITFFDAYRGWAVGNASAMYPAGVFRTEDGGRSWASVPSGETHGWSAGDFRDPLGGAVAGRDGALSLVQQTAIRPSRTPSLGARHLHRLKLDGPTGGWLVGDGGIVLTTNDGGLSWTMPRGQLPYGTYEQFDFHALAVLGRHCWIAGSPGTCVFHSADGGQRWQAFRTDQNLPIRNLTFLDERHGWAVGSLGTILATRDGGQTWRRQQGGGGRTALLGLYSEADRVPLELFARLAGDEGYLSHVEILNRRDIEVTPDCESPLPDRTHEALVAAGASGADAAWRFPLRQAGLQLSGDGIIDGWNMANDGRGTQRLEEHVVRKIRQWRPDVIVTEHISPRGDDPQAHLINQIVLAAAEKAADGTAYSEQVTAAHLQPWRVKKVFGTLPAGEPGTVNLTTAQLAPRLGRSLAEHAAASYGLINDQHRPAPQTIGFQLLIDRLPQDIGRRDFLSGIVSPAGSDSRRVLGLPPGGNLNELRLMAQRQRNIEQLLTRSESDPHSGAAWLAQIDDLTKGIHPSSAGGILFQMAMRYHQSGRSELAAEALELLTQRYEEHELTEAALVWLVQYYASSEAAWRLRRDTRFNIGLVAAEEPSTAPPFASPRDSATTKFETSQSQDEPQVLQPQIRAIGKASTAAAGNDANERAARAVALGKLVESKRPTLFADATLRFPLAAAQRRQGSPREAERYYNNLAAGADADAWTICARGELWLMHGNQLPPKSVLSSKRASTKPRLDGRLNDEVWQQAKPVELSSIQRDDDNWPATAMLAHDGEFLYLAATCRKAAGATYPTNNDPRPRDADLADRDRVDLLIDLDRDYATYYRFTFDHRGWTSDVCLGDKTWDPQWFVAAASDDATWTIEAAIPLAELTGEPITPRTVWAIGIQRTVPGVGFQSWTQPAAILPRPEGFGWLMFE